MAGIAVGSGPNYSGVAVGADLISIQIASRFDDPDDCDPDPAPCTLSWTSDQIAAFDYVYDTLRHSHTIAAVNLSWGGGLYTSPCDAQQSATKASIDNLRSVGIASTISAGNDGALNALAAPACISSAISVGAVNDAGGIPSFSNRASFLSLWAHGASIGAPRWQSTGYVFASGTSMAAPHVAGVWAILRQAVPGVTVSDALAALQATGLPPIHASEAQTVYPQVMDAIAELLPDCSNGVDDDGDGFLDHPGRPGVRGCQRPQRAGPAAGLRRRRGQRLRRPHGLPGRPGLRQLPGPPRGPPVRRRHRQRRGRRNRLGR